MKVKTISRTEETYCRKSKHDITKVQKNRDPLLHPFERAREYTKALVATKLDKMFAKPFVYALDGHTDGVYCSSTVRASNVAFLSGSCDGEVKVWDLSQRTCVWSTIAHTGYVRGITPNETGSTFFTCSDDKTIKQWGLVVQSSDGSGSYSNAHGDNGIVPLSTYMTNHSVLSIDHHWKDKQFASCGDVVSIWDESRNSEPVHSYKWGADTVMSVAYNPAEATLLASTGNDRSVCLYDLRTASPMTKFMLPMNSNKVVWNPMEPMNFILGNEDYNVYSFDMRKLDKALMIHKDHVAAVMDVAFSPTGREFATASYDKTVRLFKTTEGRSREVYHTKRMQRVFSVNYSNDAQFVFSGSDDTNIRVWKAQASKSLGVSAGRMERKEQIHDTIKRRFAHMPEIKRINRDKKLPRVIKKMTKLKHDVASAARKRTDNRKRHANEGDHDVEPERERVVVKKFT